MRSPVLALALGSSLAVCALFAQKAFREYPAWEYYNFELPSDFNIPGEWPGLSTPELNTLPKIVPAPVNVAPALTVTLALASEPPTDNSPPLIFVFPL